jgi:osmotically-inducible protein OsmY
MAASSRVGSVVACLIGTALFVAVVCDAATERALKDDDSLTKLFAQRAELAEKAYQSYAVAYQAGTVTLDSVLAANFELAEAKLPLCKTKKERIGVLEKQLQIAKDYEAQIKALNNVNAKGGEFEKLYRTGVERVKAEIALELERRDAASAVH